MSEKIDEPFTWYWRSNSYSWRYLYLEKQCKNSLLLKIKKRITFDYSGKMSRFYKHSLNKLARPDVSITAFFKCLLKIRTVPGDFRSFRLVFQPCAPVPWWLIQNSSTISSHPVVYRKVKQPAVFWPLGWVHRGFGARYVACSMCSYRW